MAIILLQSSYCVHDAMRVVLHSAAYLVSAWRWHHSHNYIYFMTLHFLMSQCVQEHARSLYVFNCRSSASLMRSAVDVISPWSGEKGASSGNIRVCIIYHRRTQCAQVCNFWFISKTCKRHIFVNFHRWARCLPLFGNAVTGSIMSTFVCIFFP